MKRRLLVPFLMGQRRDGLARVCELDRHDWQVVQVDECQATTIADRGEQMRSMGKVYGRLAAAVRDIVRAGDMPVSISGDCVSSLGMLGGLQQAGRPPERILWLDAHGDFHTWNTSQTRYLGGMPLAMLVGRPDRRRDNRDAIGALRSAVGVTPFPEQRIVLSDARDLDPGEAEAVAASGLVQCEIGDILRHLSPAERLYLHFDTDVIDAEAQMPALKYHVKAGPSLADMGALFRALRGYNIVAVSVSAWHEEKDVENRAALACLELLRELDPEPDAASPPDREPAPPMLRALTPDQCTLPAPRPAWEGVSAS